MPDTLFTAGRQFRRFNLFPRGAYSGEGERGNRQQETNIFCVVLQKRLDKILHGYRSVP